MPANLENLAVVTRLKKVSFHSNSKGKTRECLNYWTTVLISHTSKVMLKILQARLKQYMNLELPDVKARLRKGRGTRDQIHNIQWIIEKQEWSRKHLFLYWLRQSLDYVKWSEVSQLCPTLWTHWWDCSPPVSSIHPWGFPGKSTRVGCHSFSIGIFPTQGLNTGLPYW